MEKTMNRKSERGFTLIEIISILVLLGVLAAVIVPKYNSLVGSARNSAAMQAVAEGMARVNMAAANYILIAGTTPKWADLKTSTYLTQNTVSGDYGLAYAASTLATNTDDSQVLVSATGLTGNAAGGYATGTASLPQ